MKRSKATLPSAVLVSFAAGLLYAWILQARVTTQTVEIVLGKLGGPKRVISQDPGRLDINPESTETRTIMEQLKAEGSRTWERPTG